MIEAKPAEDTDGNDPTKNEEFDDAVTKEPEALVELADQFPRCSRQVKRPTNSPSASIPPTAKATVIETMVIVML